MTTNADRKSLHAYLEPEDHDAWLAAADHLGVSVTALISGITGSLDKLIRRTEVATAARQLDNARHRRPHNGRT